MTILAYVKYKAVGLLAIMCALLHSDVVFGL